MYDIYRTDRIGIVKRGNEPDQEFLGWEFLLNPRSSDYHDDNREGRSIFSLIGAFGYVASVFLIYSENSLALNCDLYSYSKAASADKAINAGTSSQVEKLAGRTKKVRKKQNIWEVPKRINGA